MLKYSVPVNNHLIGWITSLTKTAHVVKTIQIIKIYSVFCISHATLKGLLYLIGRNNRPLPVI